MCAAVALLFGVSGAVWTYLLGELMGNIFKSSCLCCWLAFTSDRVFFSEANLNDFPLSSQRPGIFSQ
jgi:hypothetical protein